ncbi:hypothetical protein L484_020330 [Morus notabilis]|uniref:Uncharacterized protein n=1 Tax=Morus notabilis TaxID=981085 RepID=W9S443_9ROSA|nr:hypothetical protein L484_020330 [Morus notabilis]
MAIALRALKLNDSLKCLKWIYLVPNLHRFSYFSTSEFSNEEGSAFDFGELEQAIGLQEVKIGNDEAKAPFFTVRPAATLEMFPSWPMRYQQTPRVGSTKSGGESTDSGSALNHNNNNNTLSSKEATNKLF